MGNEDNQNREHELRERIMSLIRSNEQASKPPLSKQDLQKLKNAATRLDQILESSSPADQQALQSAAARLDQLLADMRTGKDVTQNLKRGPSGKNPGELKMPPLLGAPRIRRS